MTDRNEHPRIRTIHDGTTSCADDACCCEPEPRWQQVRDEMERESTTEGDEVENATDTDSDGDVGSTDARFHGVARLFGVVGLEHLRRAHVCVVGIGGVGSWVVEGLARSAVGAITLIDLDEVCASNINRQLHATDDTVGRAKIDVMHDRIRGIAPDCVVRVHQRFFTAKTADELLSPSTPYTVVVDAIDSMKNKALLIAGCIKRDIHVVTVGGAGGKTDPTHIRVGDLAVTYGDALLSMTRRALRQAHGFPNRGVEPFGVPCVFSAQPVVYPDRDGGTCDTRPNDLADKSMRLSCEQGFGASVCVTAPMGFAAASLAIEHITGVEHTVPTGPPSRDHARHIR